MVEWCSGPLVVQCGGQKVTLVEWCSGPLVVQCGGQKVTLVEWLYTVLVLFFNICSGWFFIVLKVLLISMHFERFMKHMLSIAFTFILLTS